MCLLDSDARVHRQHPGGPDRRARGRSQARARSARVLDGHVPEATAGTAPPCCGLVARAEPNGSAFVAGSSRGRLAERGLPGLRPRGVQLRGRLRRVVLLRARAVDFCMRIREAGLRVEQVIPPRPGRVRSCRPSPSRSGRDTRPWWPAPATSCAGPPRTPAVRPPPGESPPRSRTMSSLPAPPSSRRAPGRCSGGCPLPARGRAGAVRHVVPLRGRHFTAGGAELPYFVHPYNPTWRSDGRSRSPSRSSSGPGCGVRAPQIGNVLAHYVETDHLRVDEVRAGRGGPEPRCPGLPHPGPLDWIIAISTLEHVGWDEEPVRPGARPVRALEHLRGLPRAGRTPVR